MVWLADTTYNFDLQLIGGESGAEVTATRAIEVIVDAAPVTPPDPPDEDATAVFMADIEKSDFDWFSAGRIVEGSGGSSIDWDNDEIANPYDWTPLPGVTLTTGNEDGSADNRWPIYNVWQLQAIDGMSVSRDGDKSSSDAFFGANRLSLHYRLAANIDAMPTRKWKNSGNLTVGFDPIGDTFTGSFDGEGREIRGLYMNLNGNAGLFHGIGADATVSRLGLPDVEIRASGASNRVAAVAHENNGLVSLVWATGEIVADNGFVGGLVRSIGNGTPPIAGQMRESWFVGKVRGSSSTGGLVGYGARGDVRDSWAVARVEWSGRGSAALGGLVGASEGNFTLTTSWSGSWVDPSTNGHALIGGSGSFDNRNYFDRSISRNNTNVTRAPLAVETMVTVTDTAWLPAAWRFGESTATDYPFLQGIEDLWPGLQAVAFADYQTDLLLAGAVLSADGAATPVTVGMTVTLDLDTNGLAPNDPDDDNQTPTPTCANGATEAKTNYNDVTVRLQTTGEGAASFTADCEINVGYRSDASTYDNFTVSLIIASQKATISSRAYSFELGSPFAFLPAEVFVPADAPMGYEFLTVTLLRAGELIRDEDDRVSVVGQVDRPPTILTIVGEVKVKPSDPLTTVTSTITLSTPTRVSVVGATQSGNVAVFSLLDGGATKFFANDDEVFALSLEAIVDGRANVHDAPINLRSMPRVRVATPSPLEIALAQGRVGATVLKSGAAGIAIWHNFRAPETYSIVQTDSFFGVDIATGLVTVAEELSANTPYEFMLELKDGTFTATREFAVMTGEQAAEQATLVVLNFRAPAAGEVVATLGWRPISGAESYTLSRAEGSETGAYTPIDTSGGEVELYRDFGNCFI